MFQEVDSTYIKTKVNQLKDDYLIQPGDEITLKVYTRDGASLVEAIQTNVINTQEQNQTLNLTTYIVSNTGIVNLPIIGTINVSNQTELMLKEFLEKQFQANYKSPFVDLKVTNRRAFVFSGNKAAVVTLNRTPTSIFEVLAKYGGLERHMNTKDIKIIRNSLYTIPNVYNVNLNTFKGIQESELTIQSNDIIYVPEKNRALYYAIQDVAPIILTPLTALTTTVSTILLIITINK